MNQLLGIEGADESFNVTCVLVARMDPGESYFGSLLFFAVDNIVCVKVSKLLHRLSHLEIC